MKYLVYPKLQKITSILQNFDLGDRIVKGRVEAYSCKRAGDEKRQAQEIEKQLTDEIKFNSLTPGGQSPFGPLTSSTARKLLIDLISTLNASFPDYDFSNLRPDQFGQEVNPNTAMTSIEKLLLNHMEQSMVGFRTEFWKALDEVIDIHKCEVYSYVPEPDSDAMAVGKLWTVNYFFVNKKAKKIVFFACFAVSKLHAKLDMDGEVIPDSDNDADEEFDLAAIHDMDEIAEDEDEATDAPRPRTNFEHDTERLADQPEWVKRPSTARPVGFLDNLGQLRIGTPKLSPMFGSISVPASPAFGSFSLSASLPPALSLAGLSGSSAGAPAMSRARSASNSAAASHSSSHSHYQYMHTEGVAHASGRLSSPAVAADTAASAVRGRNSTSA